ncbi:MAG: hypothetical protein ABJA16_11185 [Nakamurella sp.]
MLTGGPAVGKSSTALGLASLRTRAAVIDVDDVRHLVVSGGVAPWKGDEGRRQAQLGVQNACALARNFGTAEIDVVIADVLTPDSARLYRQLLPECLVVRLVVAFAEAQRRAATRKVFLTAQEFEQLHRADRSAPPLSDHVLDVDHLSVSAQVCAVADVWRRTES